MTRAEGPRNQRGQAGPRFPRALIFNSWFPGNRSGLLFFNSWFPGNRSGVA